MKDSLIVKHNNLIQSRHDLTLNEQKVAIYAISKLNREQKEFNAIFLDINEFTELIDTKGKRYDEIRNIAIKLRQKDLVINTDVKDYRAGWFSSVTFYKKDGKNTGKIKIKFDDDLIPYLLQLQEQFTKYQLKNILFLNNKYSIRIYEMCKQYQKIGRREFTIEEFRRCLMIENKYERIYDLELKILKPVTEEINGKTDIHIEIDKIKKGRKVVGFMFRIESKDKQKEVYDEFLKQLYNPEELKEKMGLKNEKFNLNQVMEIYEMAVEKTQDIIDPMEYVRLNYLKMKEKGSVRFPFAYLMSAIEDDYAKAAGQLNLLHLIDK